MTPTAPYNVTSLDGRQARLTDPAAPEQAQQVLLHLEDGRRLVVPSGLLERQPDGNYRLLLDLSQMALPATRRPAESVEMDLRAAGEAQGSSTAEANGETLIVLPVTQEELQVHKRQVDAGGVRVTTHVEREERLVDEPGYVEEIEVTRTPLNQVVESAPEPRHEGDDLVIPILEEVLVVEKRLVVKEELRISKRRREIRNPQRVTLRRLDAAVEHLPPTTAGDD